MSGGPFQQIGLSTDKNVVVKVAGFSTIGCSGHEFRDVPFGGIKKNCCFGGQQRARGVDIMLGKSMAMMVALSVLAPLVGVGVFVFLAAL